MKVKTSPLHDSSYSRRSFLGTAAAAFGTGAILAPELLAQPLESLASSTASPQNDPPSEQSAQNVSHITSLAHKQSSFSSALGSLTKVDSGDMHRMKGLSIRRLLLAPNGVREPHWHVNAHELGYCLSGDHLVTIASNHSKRDSFTISAGEMFFVPSGSLHHIENIGSNQSEIILGFSHEHPEDFGISGTMGSFTDAVLGNTFGLPASAFAGIKRSPKNTTIGKRSAAVQIELQQKEKNPYKLSLEQQSLAISSPAGSARLAKSSVWPALEEIAMFSVDLTHQGMRELHWHPETAEMGYITQGRGRMTIVSPGGSIDTFEMHPGDVYFIPIAYPHHFEDIGEEDLKLLVFFSKTSPGDVGLKTAVPCFSKEVLAASFGVEPAIFPDIPLVAEDPLIVPRINAIDPVRNS